MARERIADELLDAGDREGLLELIRDVAAKCAERAHDTVDGIKNNPKKKLKGGGSRKVQNQTLGYIVKRTIKAEVRNSGVGKYVKKYRKYKRRTLLGVAITKGVAKLGYKTVKFGVKAVQAPARLAGGILSFLIFFLCSLIMLVVITPVTWPQAWAGLKFGKSVGAAIIPGAYDQTCGPILIPVGGATGLGAEIGQTGWDLSHAKGPDPKKMYNWLVTSSVTVGKAFGTAKTEFQKSLKTGEKPMQVYVHPGVQETAAQCCAATNGGTMPAGFTNDTITNPALVAAQAAYDAGWRGDDLLVAVAIAGHESGGWNPLAANPNSTARGLWQVMLSYHLPKFDGADWRDPAANARVAYQIWKEAGGWSPWQSYTNDGYKKFIDQARAAVIKVEKVQGPQVPPKPVNIPANVETIATPECGVESSGYTDTSGQDNAWGGYSNGRIPDSELTHIVGNNGSDKALRNDAAAAFVRLSSAYGRDMGTAPVITDAYRSYAEQVDVYRRKPGLAAKPGTSNHGWGVAIDFGGGVNSFGTPQYNWMKAHAAEFGWHHPSWAEPSGSRPEPWHWEYKKPEGTSV